MEFQKTKCFQDPRQISMLIIPMVFMKGGIIRLEPFGACGMRHTTLTLSIPFPDVPDIDADAYKIIQQNHPQDQVEYCGDIGSFFGANKESRVVLFAYSVCDLVSEYFERAPEVGIRARWTHFNVAEDSIQITGKYYSPRFELNPVFPDHCPD